MTLIAGGCARRTDAETQQAWDQAQQASDPALPEAPSQGRAGRSKEPAKPRSTARGWHRVDEIVALSVDFLGASPGPDAIARLADDWCEVEPMPKMSAHGEVRVCHPDPPVRVRGHTFTLELGAVGMIGLVATELSQAQSQSLAAQARSAAQQQCTSAWQPVIWREDKKNNEEFHTCPTAGGSTLAVGRLASAPPATDWQVSIAVLGAS